MSDSHAIDRVTEQLTKMLEEMSSLATATEPLDQIAGLGDGKPLNLYLYQILPNAHWRNGNIPWRTRNGEAAPAPLALDLRYLLTATSRKHIEAQSHLGAGMLALHDNPVLYPGDYHDTDGAVRNPEGAAVRPFERARITLHPLSIEEMERLWMGVPAPRFLSVAYEVSVVLIESAKPTTLPLPVLFRGKSVPDYIDVQAGIQQQFPAIERIEVRSIAGSGKTGFDDWLKLHGRAARTVAQIDDEVRIYGPGLAKATEVRLTSLMNDTIKLMWTPNAPQQLDQFSIAEDGALTIVLAAQKIRTGGFPAGLCRIVVVLPDDTNPEGSPRVTNSVPLAFAPKIKTVDPMALTIPGGSVTVTADPPIIAGQKVSLILRSREIQPAADVTTSPLPFNVALKAPDDVGDHRVRLRVDGVDSIVIKLDFDPKDRPTFTDPLQVPKPP